MNPREFLEVADELAAGIREGDWRSAASRAYYAVFHVARRLLLQCGFNVPQADQAHAYLWLRLGNTGHPDVEQAGKDLRHLRSVRNQADYQIDDFFAHLPAVDAVQLAIDLIRLLEAVAVLPHVVTQITAAIRVYERDVLRQVTWQA